jgi:transmembrane sensor
MEIDLLINYLANETSAEENIAVKKWCDEDISHQKELETLQTIWSLSGIDHARPSADAAQSLARFKEKFAAQKRTVVVSISKPFQWNDWIKIAAIFIGIPIMIWFFIVQTKTSAELTASTTVQPDTTLLSDGSVVVLNRNSSLKYPRIFSGNSRTVSLTKGEAFFKVSHNRKKPFFVLVNGIQIRVVGTAFNVKTRNGQTEIIVESGRVLVGKNKEQILLTPAESTLISNSAHHLSKEKHTNLLYNYYRSKEFIANGTPLWELAAVLEEAYDVHISFETKEIKNLPMSTTFKNESIDNILNVIGKTFNLKVSKKGSQISFRYVD